MNKIIPMEVAYARAYCELISPREIERSIPKRKGLWKRVEKFFDEIFDDGPSQVDVLKAATDYAKASANYLETLNELLSTPFFIRRLRGG